jgi:hypothetical protein
MLRTVVVPRAFLTAAALRFSYFAAYSIRDFLSTSVTTQPFPAFPQTVSPPSPPAEVS